MDIECVDFSVHPENQYFSEQDGILYDKNKTTIVCAVETITSVDIPDTVTTIGNLAFWKQNLQEISLHEGIETIGTSAFAYSKIKEIVLPQSLKNLGHSAFFSMAKLEKVVLPEKIIDIPAYSFENCINLKQITLPVSVNGICMNAFKGTGLEEVVLPRNVNYIETDAFATNTLKKVTFLGHPYDSYNMIKEDAFGNNTQLTIYAYAGAKGERFAKELGLDLVVMLDWLEVSFVGDIVYNGQEQKPAFSSRYLPSDFKEGVDYTIVYKNNIEPGEATAEITGIG